VGQIVAPVIGEKISYKYALDKAMKENNKKAIKELESINSSNEYLTIKGNDRWFRNLKTQRKWLVELGGEVYNQTGYSFFTKTLMTGHEYTLLDFVRFALGSNFSLKLMWPEVMKIDFFKQIPKLDVPVLFIAGRHDYNTPATLVKEYYSMVNAPKKDFIWFENSGHHPMYEESELFDKIIVEKLFDVKS
jgi:pimeloyl-ACP methyl ester carboxylesterase